MEGGREGGPLASRCRSAGRESTQRLCTCSKEYLPLPISFSPLLALARPLLGLGSAHQLGPGPSSAPRLGTNSGLAQSPGLARPRPIRAMLILRFALYHVLHPAMLIPMLCHFQNCFRFCSSPIISNVGKFGGKVPFSM